MFEDIYDSIYPSDEVLKKIENACPNDFETVARLLKDNWYYPDRVKFIDKKVLLLSTGGWSGNEDLIAAIPDLWSILYQKAYRTGGYFVFANSNDCDVWLKVEINGRAYTF